MLAEDFLQFGTAFIVGAVMDLLARMAFHSSMSGVTLPGGLKLERGSNVQMNEVSVASTQIRAQPQRTLQVLANTRKMDLDGDVVLVEHDRTCGVWTTQTLRMMRRW